MTLRCLDLITKIYLHDNFVCAWGNIAKLNTPTIIKNLEVQKIYFT